MLDLDAYINNSTKIRLFGEEYDILEPTIGMTMEVDRIESDINTENLHEKRLETAVLFLNHNRQGKRFSLEELKKIPFEGLSRLLAELSLFRLKADQDPNYGSQSQMEK